MKSEFLKKIIAVAVVSTSISSFVAPSAFAEGPSDYYTWQNMNYGQSNGYWKQYSGKWYYSNYDGTIQTGWVYDNGQWYYMDSNGIMQTGVVQVNGKIYIFSESGAMQTGNAVINGKYYTFDENGAATGKNVPTPTKAYDLSGTAAVPYTSNEIITDEDSSPSSPTTVARDPNNLIKYDVKFKDDDGDEFSTKTIEKDDKITLYKPTKSGYSFVEWSTKKNGDGKSYDAGESITIKGDITLYAQWEEASTSDPDTGEDVLVEDITVTSSNGNISTLAGTTQMNAKVLPVDATNTDVTWSVSDETKASITSKGVLTAKANGTISVIATAKDTSKVVGKTTILITGQADSGTTNPGGGTTNPGGGGTTPDTGGTITAFDPTVKLDDVIINAEGNIVDLPLLKASGKLPTKAKVTCSLSSGTVKEIEVGITNWTGTYEGAVGTYNLTATLGALPSGYTKASTAGTMPNDIPLKVRVTVLQQDIRKTITGAASIAPITLDYDKHMVSTDVLNAAGILPKTVTLNYTNGAAVGTVVANVKSWSCDEFAGAIGNYVLVADIESPVGYVIPSDLSVEATLNVITEDQTPNIQEIVGVVKNADIPDTNDKLVLDYVAGDALDLKNLIVNVKYNDGTSGQISYDEFAANNITTPGYFQGMILSTANSTTLGIPVMYNNKKVYSEPLKVVAALSPTIAAEGSTTYSTTTPSDVIFNYTLGTGPKEATGIESVTLNGVEIDYTSSSNQFTISASKLGAFIDGKKTPATYALKVTFTPKQGTVKPTSNATIGFISTPAAPTTISLASTQDSPVTVPAKDKTMQLKGLTPGLTYEYCVGNTENWSNAKYFATTIDTKELTDTSFEDGKNLYVRIKSISNGGIVNPESLAQTLLIKAENIGKTLSSEKSITAFSLSDGVKSYAGTITEGSKSGKIKVVVPTTDIPGVMDVSSLIAKFTLSQTDNTKVTAKVGATTQVNETTPNNFTSTVQYTVIAEDGTTKVYDVSVVTTALQASYIRTDTLQKTVTVPVIDPVTKLPVIDPVTQLPTTTTEIVSVYFADEYNSAGLAINPQAGSVKITVPSIFTGTGIIALDNIKNGTLFMKDTDKQTAYVGMQFIKPYTNATSVKVAGSLDDLKNGTNVTTVQLSTNGANTLGAQYLEQIPVAKFGTEAAGVWSKYTGSNNTTKYYAWLDSNQNIVGYTSLKIIIQ